MSSYQLVIFDCDGVIVDSEPLAAKVISEMAAELGLQISQREAEERFNGRKIAEWIQELEADVQRPLADTFIPEFRARSAERFQQELQPVSGIKNALERLKVPYCMASSGPMTKINVTLTSTRMMPYFKGKIFSGYELQTWKPDPGLFLHAAKAFNTPPHKCAVIEDSLAGVQAGLAAGMTVFHYQPENPAQVSTDERVVRFSSMALLPGLIHGTQA